MESIIRSPAVAGRFYPGTDDSLRIAIQELSSEAPAKRKKVLAAVSPHAGYMYSGGVAAETLGSIVIPETVIILGPNHTGQGAPVSLSTAIWDMPMGRVPVDQDFVEDLLAETSYIEIDELAHRYEHSLEVQIPFLQMGQPRLSIVPIVISHISYPVLDEIGLALAEVIKRSGKEILIVASSDMTHYEPREAADKKDHYVLKKLADMDPDILYRSVTGHRISMCGIMPVTVALIAALELGATKTEVIRYTDSGEMTGDTDQVVGYAGVLIS
ncbi:MAG: AmmeMemoRadiSam system protein B [Proteobacteria bacterium]|nr:AmmeMemoRadiSam system protein B [Pseudomonadota bacterium]MBU1420468.1 AmmeMemoRadiSam system protein B [Pseudomonadota bacterium]MBU1454296.1 AmmeMemoRadiSam system protein B [Pseudomonadota bacterium]